ncbi:DUF6573 family protein [Sorangium sp. So ce1151]|uniref:DUF6573 family protein n=1 Tax=Sorangium sp. So ce1151 TaxID=3133332 RepID=UPI003F5F7039
MKEPGSPGSFEDADFIHSYSRKQAIEDGVLVNVTSLAKEAGFKVPVALTAALRARLQPSERDAQMGQSFDGRLWDVLMVLRSCAGDSDTVFFDVVVAEEDKQCTVHLKAIVGPGDDADPVITIMFQNED